MPLAAAGQRGTARVAYGLREPSAVTGKWPLGRPYLLILTGAVSENVDIATSPRSIAPVT